MNWERLDRVEQFWVKYEGQFKEDLKNGLGVLYFSNGESFSGVFRDDLPEGVGNFKSIDGSQIKGVWSNGVFVEESCN